MLNKTEYFKILVFKTCFYDIIYNPKDSNTLVLLEVDEPYFIALVYFLINIINSLQAKVGSF